MLWEFLCFLLNQQSSQSMRIFFILCLTSSHPKVLEVFIFCLVSIHPNILKKLGKIKEIFFWEKYRFFLGLGLEYELGSTAPLKNNLIPVFEYFHLSGDSSQEKHTK